MVSLFRLIVSLMLLVFIVVGKVRCISRYILVKVVVLVSVGILWLVRFVKSRIIFVLGRVS